MKLFIDSANIEELIYSKKLGVVSGVTTNPTILARNKISIDEAIDKIGTIFDESNQTISLEVDEGDEEVMYIQAKKIHQEFTSKYRNCDLAIKLPMTEVGLKLCKRLTDEGIKTNVTLIFSLSQAILAIEAGATFISPFMGRLDNWKANPSIDAGYKLIKNISDYKKLNNIKNGLIIAASIRNTFNIEQAALAGADIATVPFSILKEMYNHELTTSGLKQFAEDAKLNK